MVLFSTRKGLQSIRVEHLYLPLGLRELPLAVSSKVQAALVRGKRLFQGILPRFHAGDKFFQLGERGFEAERFAAGGELGRFGHDWNKPLQNAKIAELHPASQIINAVKFRHIGPLPTVSLCLT